MPTTNIERSVVYTVLFHVTPYMADLPATTKVENLIISVFLDGISYKKKTIC